MTSVNIKTEDLVFVSPKTELVVPDDDDEDDEEDDYDANATELVEFPDDIIAASDDDDDEEDGVEGAGRGIVDQVVRSVQEAMDKSEVVLGKHSQF